VCESEENRRKLAWLVPGYILLAWFFCVVFQPLGFTSVPGRGNNNDINDESIYEIVNLQDDPQWKARCASGERQRIELGSGRASGLILRLTSNDFYRYEEYNCSVEVVAGPGMDGVTAVVEHLDLRGEEPEQWREPACPDYLDIRSEQAKVQKPICGQWDVERDHHLQLCGPEKNIVGYCVEDRSGHSCETKRILVDVRIEHNKTLSDMFHTLRKSDRHGFTVVFTAWRHADETGNCQEAEMVCPNSDGGIHVQSHCIWQKMLCDGHQNCGFLVNKDEWSCRLGRDTPWSFGTITVLVTIWIAIVTVLMLATVFLLQWNRLSFRTPLDIISEARQDGPRGGSPPVTERLQGGHVMSTASAPDPRTGGMVSIMVMYRPPTAGNQQQQGKTVDLPPTYDSLFLGENPPGYNMLTVNIPSSPDQPQPDPQQTETQDETPLQGVDITENNEPISPDRVQSNITHAIGILQRVASAQNTQVEVCQELGSPATPAGQSSDQQTYHTVDINPEIVLKESLISTQPRIPV